MAYRAYKIAPDSSLSQVEMAGWVMYGAMLLVAMLIWELVRAYFRFNEHRNEQAGHGQNLPY